MIIFQSVYLSQVLMIMFKKKILKFKSILSIIRLKMKKKVKAENCSSKNRIARASYLSSFPQNQLYEEIVKL